MERKFLKEKRNSTLISSKNSRGMVSQVLLLQNKSVSRVGFGWGISEKEKHAILSSSFKLVSLFLFEVEYFK